MKKSKLVYVAPSAHIIDTTIYQCIMVTSQYADIEEGSNNITEDGIYGQTENVEKDDSWNDTWERGYN